MFYEGVLVDHENIKIVVRCLIPKDKNEVRWFLGLVIYTRKYVRDFVKIAAPITIL